MGRNLKLSEKAIAQNRSEPYRSDSNIVSAKSVDARNPKKLKAGPFLKIRTALRTQFDADINEPVRVSRVTVAGRIVLVRRRI